ncbi:condensation domain-containing protein [Verrucosispora sioxanthis]|uniref:condensation domain-containing protein n=1 Tax=Verrucosispora sioxanthis TaxID=2499994 RepID=UPI001C114623|nr:condensation domain-containing protein [Verrucosispora sioxanthis]
MKIAFEGLRAGEGALTCGQTNTWQWMRTDVSNPMATLQWKLPLPADTPVADVVEAFAILLARHESLRTTFHEHDGEMRQRVLRSGVLAAEIHQVDASADTELTSQRMIDQLRQKPFDLVNELPVRLAIALVEDKALAAVTVYSHMAVDYGSMAILGREFAELIGTAGNRSVGAARHQPLDQAAEEASPRARPPPPPSTGSPPGHRPVRRPPCWPRSPPWCRCESASPAACSPHCRATGSPPGCATTSAHWPRTASWWST